MHPTRLLMLLALLFVTNLMAEEHELFANQYAQALKYQMEPGDAVTLQPAAQGLVAITLDEGSLNIDGVLVGVQPSGFFFWNPGKPISVTNTGHRSVGLMVARIKALTGLDAGSGTLAKVNLHHLMHENDALEIYRVTIPPGADTGMHHHTRRGMGFVVGGGKLRVTLASGKTLINEAVRGTLFWHEEEVIHSLVNIGESDIQVLDMEWK